MAEQLLRKPSSPSLCVPHGSCLCVPGHCCPALPFRHRRRCHRCVLPAFCSPDMDACRYIFMGTIVLPLPPPSAPSPLHRALNVAPASPHRVAKLVHCDRLGLPSLPLPLRHSWLSTGRGSGQPPCPVVHCSHPTTCRLWAPLRGKGGRKEQHMHAQMWWSGSGQRSEFGRPNAGKQAHPLAARISNNALGSTWQGMGHMHA